MPESRLTGIGASAVLTVVVVLAASLAACGDDGSRQGRLVMEDPASVEADFQYVIPPGAGARSDAGEAVEILPRQMVVRIGEVMRIVNQDDRDHRIGPFFIGAGETLTQRFASAGQFAGLCTVHPSGEFVLTVTE